MAEIRLLTPQDDRKNFSCSNIELDYYFQKFAGQSQFKNYIGTNYVLVEEDDILGFVSVTSSELYKASLSPDASKGVPNYPLPVLRLTRLGVKSSHQKTGVGRALLQHVLKLALKQKERVGCFGVIVDAKEGATLYYEKYGFIALEMRSKSQITSMFIATKTIERSI